MFDWQKIKSDKVTFFWLVAIIVLGTAVVVIETARILGLALN